jgi:two-component system response regulator RpfG
MSTVLIVDDQFTSRKILAELVQKIENGLDIVTFVNPLEALEWSREAQADLVITDYKMPELDGVEFTRRFRSTPHGADIPLVVITVVEDRNIRYQALEAGATDFLTKPIDHYEVQARCRNLLTLRRQQRIIKDRAKWLEQQVALATAEIRTREHETLLRLAKAGEYRDVDTGNHVLRMAKYSRLIADQLGLLPQESEVIEQAAPMHDIGKIGIPDSILLKRGRLTDREREVMKAHTRMGYEILKGSPSKYLQMGAIIALNHHERYDGSGYPQGLAGDRIPLAARVVAVADVYDALTTVRPYKPAWSSEDAMDYLTTQVGRHFDPRCVEAFLSDHRRVFEVQRQLPDMGRLEEAE